jgi:hypothetical protein
MSTKKMPIQATAITAYAQKLKIPASEKKEPIHIPHCQRTDAALPK